MKVYTIELIPTRSTQVLVQELNDTRELLKNNLHSLSLEHLSPEGRVVEMPVSSYTQAHFRTRVHTLQHSFLHTHTYTYT